MCVNRSYGLELELGLNPWLEAVSSVWQMVSFCAAGIAGCWGGVSKCSLSALARAAIYGMFYEWIFRIERTFFWWLMDDTGCPLNTISSSLPRLLSVFLSAYFFYSYWLLFVLQTWIYNTILRPDIAFTICFPFWFIFRARVCLNIWKCNINQNFMHKMRKNRIIEKKTLW